MNSFTSTGSLSPTGTWTSVGSGWLTLGGRLGPLTRTHAVTCDRLLATEMVLTNRRSVICWWSTIRFIRLSVSGLRWCFTAVGQGRVFACEAGAWKVELADEVTIAARIPRATAEL